MPKLTLCATLAAVIAFTPATVLAVNIAWDEHVDVWSDFLNWSPAVVPGAGDSVLIGNDLDGQDDHVDVDIAAHAGALTVSEGGFTPIADTLDINNGRSLAIHGGGIVNDGHIELNAGANTTTLSFVGTGPGGIPQVIAGRGEIVMSDSLNNIISTNNVVIKHGNGFGHVIRGAGRLLNNTGGMINTSTIRAEGVNKLIIDPNGLGFANDNGTLAAAANGTLRLESGTFTQTNFGGIVTLAPSALVEIASSTIIGGTLSGTGTVNAVSSTFDNVAVINPTTVETDNGALNTIQNGLNLLGTWNLNGGANTTFMRFSGAQTLTGTGELVLTDALTNIIDIDNKVLTIDSGMTVRGAGRLMNNSGGLVNNGTILAQGNQQLVLDVNGLDFDQNGVLRAEGAGGLYVQNSVVDLDATHGIDVDPGSALLVTGSTLNTGALNLGAAVSADIQSSTLDAMTINGLAQTNNGILNTFKNGLTLNGVWNLNGGANTTFMRFSGAQSLTGTGELVLTDALTNIIDIDNKVLTIDSDITVRGAGRLMNNTGGLVNNGTILAQGNEQLILDVNGLHVDQNGVLRAEGAGGLYVQNSVVNLDATHGIDVDPGSALLVTGSTLNTGALNLGAAVSADIQSSTLDAMTINGLAQTNNGILNTFKNGLTLNGVWNLNGGANNTFMRFSGAQTLTGSNGELVLTDALTNIIDIDNKVLTIDSDITVRGAGRLMNNTGGLVNNGTILAQGNEQLILDVNGLHFDQNNVLRAEGAGGLYVQNSVVDLDATHGIDVDPGSALLVTGSTLNTGALNLGAAVSADIRASTLDTMTINGLAQTNNGILNTFKNGLTLNGVWNLNSTGANTFMRFSDAQSLTGTGELVLTDALTNIIDIDNKVLTIDSDITVRGAGRLMNNTGGLVNNGTILAEGNEQLILDVNGLHFDQNNVLRAEGAGGLYVQNSVVDLDATHGIDVDPGSALLVTGSTLNTGALNLGAAVSADIRASTLDTMTINGLAQTNNGILNTFKNGLTLNGVWNLNSTGANTFMRFSDAQSLTGTGELVLTDALTNIIDIDNKVLTIDSDITVRGAGRLMNNSGGVINKGTINATGGNALHIDPNGLGFENQGMLLASGSGGLVVQDNFEQTAGLTRVDTTLTMVTGAAQINGGVLGGSGTIMGDVAVAGSGQVNPGNSPGTLSIIGDYSQSGTGELLIEIAGLASFDVLDVDGTATLGGTLAVELLGGFNPALGTTFDILIAASVSGAFANGTVSAGGNEFAISYIDGLEDIVRLTTTVSAVPLPPALWLFGAALGLLLRPRNRTA